MTLAPAVPDLAALGAAGADDLLDPAGRPVGWERAELVAEDAGAATVRLPLPGTPDASGRVFERPRGAGTGHVLLKRFDGTGRGALWRALRARFTRPPSESLAEREWNLLCHLRAAGVGTPEPLAVGARGPRGFASRSFLVTRDPEGFRPLAEWLGAAEGEARLRGLRAVGAFLARLFRSGTRLPALAAEDVLLSADEACAAEEIDLLASGARTRPNRLPGVVLARVEGGRILPRLGLDERLAALRRLDEGTRGVPGLTGRDRARVLARALRDVPRAERRAALERLRGRP